MVARTRALDALAREAAAEFLLHGQLDRRGDSVVAIVQILEAQTGRLLHQTEPVAASRLAFDHVVMELRERAGGAAIALSDTLFPLWRAGRSRPPTYSAYHEFSQGIDALVNQGAIEAISHFLKAMTLDPEFAQAKLWYLEQASEVGSEAVRVDSVRRALAAQRDRQVAYDQVAIDRQLAFTDLRREDAYTAAREMVHLAPRAADAKVILANSAMATRRYEEAIELLHAVRDEPDWMQNLTQRRNWDLMAHRLTGDLDRGIAEWQQIHRSDPDNWAFCRQGVALLASAGRESAVDSLLARCDRMPDKLPLGVLLTLAGQSYRVTGHREAARRAFEQLLTFRTERAGKDTSHRFVVAMVHVEMEAWQSAYDMMRAIVDTTDAEPTRGIRGGGGTRRRHGDRQCDAAMAGRKELGAAEPTWTGDSSRLDSACVRKPSRRCALRSQAGISPAWEAWYSGPSCTRSVATFGLRT